MPDLDALLNDFKSPNSKRRKPTIRARERILAIQKNCCFYCGMEFGSWFYYKKFARPVEIHWDHFVPYSYCHNSTNKNFVAACQYCNGIKHARVFQTIEKLVTYVREKRLSRNLPVRPMWGDRETKKIMAEILFADLSDHILLEENGDTPEQVLCNIREWNRLRRIVTRV